MQDWTTQTQTNEEEEEKEAAKGTAMGRGGRDNTCRQGRCGSVRAYNQSYATTILSKLEFLLLLLFFLLLVVIAS